MDKNNINFIDRSNKITNKQNDNISELLLNRQFANYYNLGSDTENKLRIPLTENKNLDCSKKEINWGDYYLFPTGKSAGNPNDYNKTYVGVDTRNYSEYGTNRDIDLKERPFVPLESFRFNYGGLKYEDDLRSGISTRAYRKTNSQ